MKIGPDKRTPGSPCVACSRILDCSCEVGGASTPSPGDVSLCAYCGAINIFTETLTCRPASVAEEQEIAGDPLVQAARKAIACTSARTAKWPGREVVERILNAEAN
jgi:hypothetical protein